MLLHRRRQRVCSKDRSSKDTGSTAAAKTSFVEELTRHVLLVLDFNDQTADRERACGCFCIDKGRGSAAKTAAAKMLAAQQQQRRRSDGGTRRDAFFLFLTSLDSQTRQTEKELVDAFASTKVEGLQQRPQQQRRWQHSSSKDVVRMEELDGTRSSCS